MQTWAQVWTRKCERARGDYLSFTDVKIKIPGQGDVNDVMHRRILGAFEKSQLSWVLPRKKKGDFRLLAVALWRVPYVIGGGDVKATTERLRLTPYVEKPFNSKVIKSFVPELRSRKCFSCFGIPMFYVYMLWTFYERFAYLDI